MRDDGDLQFFEWFDLRGPCLATPTPEEIVPDRGTVIRGALRLVGELRAMTLACS